jgi:cob(I)alamin adenosyltransferase
VNSTIDETGSTGQEKVAMLEFEQVTTRGGDYGESSLYDGSRLRKDDVLFAAMGDIDELSSHLGLLKASLSRKNRRRRAIVDEIQSAQETLIRIGSMVATPKASELYASIAVLERRDIERIETIEHALLSHTEVPDRFVLPGESAEAAFADVARAVCRRAERSLIACIRDRELGHLAICQNYLNRLSDYLFILARSLS